jgi:hypothetical protein
MLLIVTSKVYGEMLDDTLVHGRVDLLEHDLELGHLAVVGIEPAMISQHLVTPPSTGQATCYLEKCCIANRNNSKRAITGSLRWFTLS